MTGVTHNRRVAENRRHDHQRKRFFQPHRHHQKRKTGGGKPQPRSALDQPRHEVGEDGDDDDGDVQDFQTPFEKSEPTIEAVHSVLAQSSQASIEGATFFTS